MSLRKRLADAMLATEKSLRVSLEASARTHLESTASFIYGSPYRTQGTILQASARSARAFEHDAQVIIFEGRRRSRDTSLLVTAGLFGGLALGSVSDLDHARSEIAARGLAQKFTGISVTSFAAWLLSGKASPGSAIVVARRRMPSAIELTGSTENANAFTGAFRQIAANRNAYGYDGEWEWDAARDRVCSICAPMDGEISINGEFSNGLWPGDVHPRCRCIPIPTTTTRQPFGRSA